MESHMTRTTFRPRRRALVAAATALPLTALAACSSDTGEGPSLGGDDGEEGGGTSDGGADTSAYADVIASGPVADDDAVAASEWASAIKERGELIRRSEEHTSELQSRGHLVCRLLLEKKKNLYARKLKSLF